MKYTIEDLKKALLDVLDGRESASDIRYNTGLDIERAKEIEELVTELEKEAGLIK
jgi:hypothetical protein